MKRCSIHSIEEEDAQKPLKRPFGMRPLLNRQDIAFGCLSGLQYAVVPTCPQGPLHPKRHVRHIEPRIKLPARLASLAYLQNGRAPFNDVSDTEVRLRPTAGDQVLAEVTGNEDVARIRQFSPPSGVVFEEIAVERFFGTTTMTPIGLFVAVTTFETDPQDAMSLLLHFFV